MLADRRNDLETVARAGGAGNMPQMIQHLFFGERQALGEFAERKRLLLQQFFDSLTRSNHRLKKGSVCDI